MLTTTTALYAGSVDPRSYINIALNITPTLCEGHIVSVHRVVMENRPVDPGSIQAGSHRPIYILHKDKTQNARAIFFVKLSINIHIVLVHKNRTRYHK